jgi:hypothetical protein
VNAVDDTTLADVGTGAVLLVAGALGVSRPPSPRMGLLLWATGAAWLVGSVVDALVFLYRGPLVHLLLAYPGARLGGRARPAIVAAAYVTGAVEPLGGSDVVTVAVCAAVVGAAAARGVRGGGLERRAAAAARGLWARLRCAGRRACGTEERGGRGGRPRCL